MSETELRAFDALATHGRLSDLVALTRAVATSAAEGRTSAWMDAAKVRALAEEAKLTQDDAKTPFGNALAVLERGPEDDAERALARAMWAHAIAEAPGKGREEEDRVATDVLWLATHTPFDATSIERWAKPRASCGTRSRTGCARWTNRSSPRLDAPKPCWGASPFRSRCLPSRESTRRRWPRS